jgi:sec-independent protein translocase protein TatB
VFDISLGELLVVGVVTLVVVGPERMPKVARTAGMLFGRLQRFVNNVKVDLQREMQASELAQIQKEIEAETLDIKNTIHQPLDDTKQTLNQLETDFQNPAQPERELLQTAQPDDPPSAPKASNEPSSPKADDNQLDLFAGLDVTGPTMSSPDRR